MPNIKIYIYINEIKYKNNEQILYQTNLKKRIYKKKKKKEKKSIISK